MITIRFPTGLVVEYADANYLHRNPTQYPVQAHLYTKSPDEKGKFIADIPHGAIIEFEPPSKTYTVAKELSPTSMAKQTLANLRDIPYWIAADLKSELRNFNAKSYEWKD